MNFRESIATGFEAVRDFQNFYVLFQYTPRTSWKIVHSGLMFLNRIVIGTSWHWNGNKSTETTYRDAKIMSRTEWYKNGTMEVRNSYLNGKLDGISTQWNPLGVKVNEITYKNGEKNGPATYWYANGRVDMIGNYKNDLHDGFWLYLKEDGTPESSKC